MTIGKKRKTNIEWHIIRGKKEDRISIKIGKNTRRTYKFDYETPVDAYIQYYKDTNLKGREKKGSSKAYKHAYSMTGKTVKQPKLVAQAKRYLRRIKEKPKIAEAISKGLTTAVLYDAHNATEEKIKRTYKELLGPLTLDKELLEILMQDNNIQKIKHRFEYEIKYLETEGKQIMNTRHVGKKTLKEVVNDIKNTSKKGEKIDYGDKITNKLKARGEYKSQFQDKGTVRRVDVYITFRKAW